MEINMSIDAKKLLKEIIKEAEGLDDLLGGPGKKPGAPQQAPNAPAGPPGMGGMLGKNPQAPTNPGVSGGVGNSKVAEMQKAMQNLAFEVTRDSTSKTLGAKPQFVNKQEGSKP